MPTKDPTTKSTKPSAAKTANRNSTGDIHPQQVDDPIIVKPGGSLLIEMDVNFRDPHDPKPGKKKGHKHPDATQITYVLIKDKNDKLKTKIEITDKDDQVVICYKNPVNGCDCK